MKIALPLLLSLAACRGGKDTPPVHTGDDTDIDWETGGAVDHDDTADTGDSGDTGEDTAYTALHLEPEGLVVQPGASWRLRLTARDADGLWEDTPGSFDVGDPAVLRVDADGVVTALAAGESSIIATLGGLTDAASVTVRDDGQIVVTVVDADSGLPVSGVTVVIDEGSRVLDDDADGVVTTPVTTGGGLAVTAYARDYVPATLWATVSREVTIPLRPEADATATGGTLAGTVDLSGVPKGGVGDLQVGIAISAVAARALLVQPDDLIAPDRPITVYGIDADLPSNLYMRDIDESYAAPVRAGDVAAWTLAGPLPIADLTAGIEGSGDALALLRDHVDSLVWGWGTGSPVGDGETADVPLAPATALEREVKVEGCELPVGFSGDEDFLVLVGQPIGGAGTLMTGFGLGQGSVTARVADVSLGASELAVGVAQVNGLGSGGALVAAQVDLVGDSATLPALPLVSNLASFDGATRSFSIQTDPGQRYVHVVIGDNVARYRDLYLDSGTQEGILPEAGIPFSYGKTDWSLLSLAPEHDAFEGLVSGGALRDDQVAESARTATRVTQRF